MSEIREFALSMFSKHGGDMFQLHSEVGLPRWVELIEAKGRTTGADANEADADTSNFVLLFHDPEASAESYLPQAIYRFEHEALGTLDLFIVPIGPGKDGKGISYECVFTSTD